MKICQKMFLFLHSIGYGRFKAIKSSYLTRGVAARTHGNKGKSTKWRLSLKEIQDVMQFIMNYTCVCVYVHTCVGGGGETVREKGRESGRERKRGEGEGEREREREREGDVLLYMVYICTLYIYTCIR